MAVSRRTSGYGDLLQPGITAVQVHAPYQGSLDAELDLIGRVREEVGSDIEVWRAVSMSAGDGGVIAEGLHASVDKLVLDAHAGGSGETFDWADIPEAVKPHALLAGGLTPDNLEGALRVGCAGLDLNSGVEYPEWAGRKDAGALRRAFDIIGNYHYPRTNNE